MVKKALSTVLGFEPRAQPAIEKPGSNPSAVESAFFYTERFQIL